MDLNELLQSVPAFADFSQRELEALEQALSVTTYPDGHTFIRQGKRAGRMYLIIKGRVQVVRRNADAAGIDLNKELVAGDAFGLISMIDHGPATATCRAAGEVTVASLPHTAFDMLLRTQSPISSHFKSLVAGQLAKDVHIDRQLMAGLVEQGAGQQIRRYAADYRQ